MSIAVLRFESLSKVIWSCGVPLSQERCKIASPAVFEVLGPKHIGGHDLNFSGSRDRFASKSKFSQALRPMGRR